MPTGRARITPGAPGRGLRFWFPEVMTLHTGPLRMPAPPVERPRTPFPFIASVAPLVASVVIWAVTGSAFVLLFAALAPVIMVATLIDSRRAGRRRRRADAAAYRRRLDDLSTSIEERQVALRAAAWRCTPSAVAILSGRADDTRWQAGSAPAGTLGPAQDLQPAASPRPIVALGSGAVPSGLKLDMESPGANGAAATGEALAQRAAELRASAATLADAPVPADLVAGVGLVGHTHIVRAAARALLIQVAHSLPPDRTLITVPAGWRSGAALPHRNARAPAWEVVLADPRSDAADAAGAEEDRSEDDPHDGDSRNGTPTTNAPTRIRIALAARLQELPEGCGTVLRLHGPQRAEILRSTLHEPGLTLRPELVSECEALAWAIALAERARLAGLVSAPTRTPRLPPAVRLAELHALQLSHGASPASEPATVATPSLDCVIGVSRTGPMSIDLVRDGPHAVVGGTTGSGKSELLVSWVASIAARYRPTAVTFLLVDFKGGAAFDPLLPLPHCVGLITDLDQLEAARALASLRAELRYREQLLRDLGARDITGAAGRLPRLVIVVDEFQAMLESLSELHAAFVDIAARGRSLGIHLILCTQRPSGVVRDALLANCSLRLSLRVNNRADSQAVIGTDAAAALAASIPGRCLVASGAGAPTLCQVAVTVAADIRAIADADAGGDADTPAAPPPPTTPAPRRPWLDPLPARIARAEVLAFEARPVDARPVARPVDALPGEALGLAPQRTLPQASGGRHASSPPGLLLGLVDEPAHQRYRVARYDPSTHGSLLLLGAPGSGKSTLLAELGAESGATVIPPHVDAAWDALVSAGEGPGRYDGIGDGAATRAGSVAARLLLFDDFDSVHARWEPEYQVAALDLLTGVLRDGRSVGLNCVLAVQRLTPPMRPLLALCQSSLLLRLPNRDEHLAAGGEDALWDPELPAGGGVWQHARIQLAVGAGVACDAGDPPVAGGAGDRGDAWAAPRSHLAPVLCTDRPLVVISTRPGATAAQLRAAAGNGQPDVVELAAVGSGAASGRMDVTDAGAGSILVGDPDAWQASWPLLAALRTRVDVVFDRCSLADYRLVTRRRDLPPALAPGRGQVWVLGADGLTRRALLPGFPVATANLH
jgi:DNA segregation ATPase FtsK/SpoIIIE, S-DNA-T family